MVANLEQRLWQLEHEKRRVSGRRLTDAERAVRLVAMLEAGDPTGETIMAMLAKHKLIIAAGKSPT